MIDRYLEALDLELVAVGIPRRLRRRILDESDDHLRSDDGQRFGFEFVIFQTIRGANPIGYLAHFAVTDEAHGRFVYDARSAVDPTPTGTPNYSGRAQQGLDQLIQNSNAPPRN